MRVYEKAIIVDEPWVSMILRGEKIWEMRSKRTNFRGPVALIRKRSHSVVGTATLVDCLAPLSLRDLALHQPLHGIPASEHKAVVVLGRLIPWVLRDARALGQPISYLHRSGQQIWVRLDPELGGAIQAVSLMP